MSKNNVLNALVVTLAIGATSVQAHSGDHSFFEAFDHYRSEHLAKGRSSASLDLATTGTAEAFAKETANLFGTIHNREGQTLLPHGTVCDDINVDTSGVVTALFTLPSNFKASEIDELKLDTMNEVVRSYVGGLDLTAIHLRARKDVDSPYINLGDFLAPIMPPDESLKDWFEPNRPGPDVTDSSAAPDSSVSTRIGGQGPIGTSSAPVGALSGKVVYFTAGHGWTWNGSSWVLQRPVNLQGMNEDFGNVDQIEFLAQYLFNAGATVVPMRPIGHQPNAVVVDNPAATLTGTWSDSSSPRYYGSGTPYNFTTKSATETASATFTPSIPVAGFYPVYVWALYGSDRVDNQLYKINHTGGTSEVRINHRRVGAGWIWVGTYYFDAGSNPAAGSVVVSNQSDTATGSVIIADAVRFGNGVGPSGNIRENEAAKYWIRDGHGVGGPVDGSGDSTVYAFSGPGYPTSGAAGTDSSNTINSPPRNAAHMSRDDGQGYLGQAFVGWHSNAFDVGQARGSVALYHDTSTPANAVAFATRLSDGIDTDAYIEDDNWEYTWATRGPFLAGGYGEISSSHLAGKMVGSIIEVAFHDNVQDAALLRDPKVRNVAARGIARAVQRYFVSPTGTGAVSTTLLPEPPINLRAVNNGVSGATISWAAPPTGGANGNAATGYRVYQSTNGYGYGLAASSATPSTTITGLTPGQTYYFRVAATNAGGESMPTESLAVRVTPSGFADTLVVNGYDRLDRFNNILEPGYTSTERIRLRRNNSYNYLIEHGTALNATGRDFDSASNEAVALNLVSLANYQTVIWLLGEEDTKNQTLNLAERAVVTSFLNAGGRLFITGSEIGAHLDNVSLGDPTFYNTMLRADLAADDAGGYQAAGVTGTALDGLIMNFSPDTDMYDVDKPDRLLAINGSVVAANYTGSGSGAAAVQYNGLYHLVYFGFPFEAINTAGSRQQVMAAVLNFFDTPNSSVEDWSLF